MGSGIAEVRNSSCSCGNVGQIYNSEKKYKDSFYCGSQTFLHL